MVQFWSFRIVFVVCVFRFGRFACFGGFVSLFLDGFVALVSMVSFARFGFAFRFVVSGFSTCRKTELLCAQAGHRLRFRFKF